MTRSRTLLASLALGTSLLIAGCGGSTTAPVDSGPAPAPGSVKADPVANIPAEKTEAPKAEAPKAEAPKAEAPKAEAPKAEAPKAEAPKAEAPKAEAPKAEAPKAEAPKAEAPKAEAPKAEAPKAEAPKADAPKIEAPKADAAALSSDEKAEIAKLATKEDQYKALAQLACLISGENLGSMGVPIKVSHDGKSAFLCCKGCVKDFEKDPKAALAKLSK